MPTAALSGLAQARASPPTRTASRLTDGLEQAEQAASSSEGDKTPRSTTASASAYGYAYSATVATPPKPRSLSDTKPPPFSPSPAYREPNAGRGVSKDDSALRPSTPRRPSLAHSRGLSLTMPSSRDAAQEGLQAARVPLSPKLETANVYTSPASMLPRRSRGLDYTRACTSLHHSTLAESSPDASPITGRGVPIAHRRSLAGTSVLDSPSNLSALLWSTMPERTTLSPGMDWASAQPQSQLLLQVQSPLGQSPAQQASLMSSYPMSFRRARTKRGKSQHSSSSVSMASLKPSPGSLSPSAGKHAESAGYFGGLPRARAQSRRESLNLGTNNLHLSDGDDAKPNGASDGDGGAAVPADSSAGVVRRAVTRRGNLLPKTKVFARIKAALMEEATPADSELRREAEVIKQVHDNDPTFSPINDDANDSTVNGLLSDHHPGLGHFNQQRSRSTTPLANLGPPTAAEVARRVNNKRRRDDDFDPTYTKRRAVSPGMSVASSPVLPQSPIMTADKGWGKPPPKTAGPGERSSSGSSLNNGLKKIGMLGMNETHEGLMSVDGTHDFFTSKRLECWQVANGVLDWIRYPSFYTIAAVKKTAGDSVT
ncbi:hypothetical protein DV737_g5739, partial [Chaetothyriales sp. CBS 132003]